MKRQKYYLRVMFIWLSRATVPGDEAGAVEVVLRDKPDSPRGFCLDIIGSQSRAEPERGPREKTGQAMPYGDLICERTRVNRIASVLVLFCFLVFCAGASTNSTVPHGPQSHESVDQDGARMLFPAAPGAHFRLGTQNPNSLSDFQIERNSPASRHVENGNPIWRIAAHELRYASGGTGKTVRLHIYAGGARQLYTWKTQKGYLSSPADIRNQELTVWIRVHGIMDPKRAAISLKIRGGAHSEKNPDLASCAMMTFQAATTGAVARFGKELVHPLYDYVRLTPHFQAQLTEGKWVGLKLVSYAPPADPARVVNRLYLDVDPFDLATAKPRNDWKLFAEYIDIEGVSTGRYTKLVDWGGWQTTLRTDGIERLDFSRLSLREIVPPLE